MENITDEKINHEELYKVHKNSVAWYLSEGKFSVAEAIEKVLDGSPLNEEYAYNLRHLFGA